MNEILRKTFFYVEIGYELVCDTIGAVDARVGKSDGLVTLTLTLKPASGNQRYDEQYLHNNRAAYIQITDGRIIKRLRAYIKAHSDVKSMRVEILSRARMFRFTVKSIQTQKDHFMQLNFAAGDQ